jgi:hypothetical protein
VRILSPSPAPSQQVNRRWRWCALAAASLLLCFSWPLFAQQQQPSSTPPPKNQGTPPAQNQPQSQASPQNHREPESGDLVRKRQEWFYQQRAYPLGYIPAGARQRALEHMDRMMRDQGLQQTSQPSPQAREAGIFPSTSQAAGIIPFPGDGFWHLIGPQPTNQPFGGNSGSPISSGRITALAVDATDATGKTVFLGAAAGGIWRTTDGGTTWTALTDTQASLAIGSLAIAPSNHMVIYAGTGEDNFNVDAYQGAGVLISTNGGNTWAQTCAVASATCPFIGPLSPTLGGARVGALAVSPTDANTVLAGVAFGNIGAAAGVYRSTDGGATWTKVLGGDAGTAVLFDPGDATIAYAALGFPGGDAANGIYRSTNGGATWTKLGGGLPASTSMGRIELKIAPSTTGATAVLYAAIADGTTLSSGLLGFFQSTNGGTSWTQRASTPSFCGPSQCFYDMAVGVHPTNSSFVVVGGSAFTNNSTTLFKSTDGGATWSDSTTTNDFTIGSTSVRPHVDTHALAFTPPIAANGNLPKLYVGNDGGVWETDDPTPVHPLWVDLNGMLALTQFYPGVSTHPADENIDYGGTQDNGTESFGGTLDWTDMGVCGDGGPTAVDRVMPSTVYIACVFGSSLFNGVPVVVWKSVVNGVVLPGPTPSFLPADMGINSGDRAQFVPPLEISRNQSSLLLFGTCRVYETTNSGSSWAAISGDLSVSGNPATTCPSGGAGNVSAIDAGNNGSDVVYAGTTNGKVWKTLNATSPTPTWTEVTQPSLPLRHVTSVRSKRNDMTGATAYATFSGFGSCAGCDGKGHVFKTTDGGATWTDISHNLPDIPVNDIVVDHNGQPIKLDALYVGTDIGVFTCQDPEAATPCTNWLVEGTGLPRVPVLSVALREESRNLRAGTHGRSVWNIQLTDIPLSSIVGALMTSISPATAIAGSASLTAAVSGINFTGQTAVRWNGSTTGVTTTLVDANHLTALIDSSLLTTGTVASVDITDPNGVFGGGNLFPFTVTNPVPIPMFLSPTSGTVGQSVALHFTSGTGFINGTDVIFNGIDNTNSTASIGGTVLDITIPGSELTAPGVVHISLSNPLPGGGAIPAFFLFTINPAAGGAITMNPASANFGNQPLLIGSSTTNVVVTNSGSASVTLNSFSITGTNAGDFAQVAPTSGSPCNFSGGVLAVSGNCSFGLKFTPSAAGARSATVNIGNTGSPSPQTLPVSGNGTVPTATLSPGDLAFGSQAVGTTSAVKNETLMNTGSDTLNVTSIAKGGANPGDFNLVAPTSGNQACNLAGSFSLSPGNSCDIGANFMPTVGAPRSANVTVTDNSGGTSGTTQSFNLSGTGTSGTGTLSLNPASANFGNQRVGTTSAVQQSVLSNSGPGSVTITNIQIGGTNSGDFAGATPPAAGDCGNSVVLAGSSPGNSCNLRGTFTPTATGLRSATLTITATNSTNSPVLNLSGTGTASGVTFNPTSVPFGNQRTGTTSAVSNVQLTNSGTATLNITSIALTGADAAQFTLTSAANGATPACPLGASALNAGSACNFAVKFAPTTTGLKNASVSVTDDATGSPHSVPLTGTGTFPAATLAPPNVNFGSQRQGTTSTAQNGTLTNSGTDVLHLTAAPAITGANTTDFAIVAGGTACANGTTLNAAQSCTWSVTFTPSTTGARSASLTFTDDATGSPHSVPLSGTGVVPIIGFSPTTVNFGNVVVSGSSAPTHLHITNSGTATLSVTSITLTGADAAQFALTSAADGATPACPLGASPLGAGNTCNVDAKFGPTSTGAKSANMSVADDAPGSPQTVPLSGSGTTATINLSPSPLPFANQRRGTTSGAQTITLTNSGTSSAQLAAANAVTLSGANAADFAVTGGTCVNGLVVNAAPGPGNTCTITITFTPSTTAAEAATVTVTFQGATPATNDNLTGTGIFPAVTLTPNTPQAFGNQIIGTTSAAQVVTLQNTGTDTLNLAVASAVVLGGTNPGEFATAGTTCTNGLAIAVNGTCNISAAFAPTSQGAKAATITITDDVTPAQVINLSGTGQTPPTADLSGTNLAFGNQRVGATSAAQNVTLTNNGQASLTITGIVIGGTNAGDFAFAAPATTCPTAGGNLAGGANCIVSLTFKPTATGVRAATVTITDNAGGVAGTTQVVTLGGTGTAPAVTLAPNPLPAFGNQRVGTTSTGQTVTITNSGTASLAINSIAITGVNSGDFALTGTGATPCVQGAQVIAVGANCMMSVTFKPTATGVRNATFNVSDDATGSPHTLALSGTGIAPAVSLDKNSLAFNNQAVGTTSAPQTVTLTNTGTDTLHVSANVPLSGANASEFNVAAGTTCVSGAAIPPAPGPGSTCIINFTFKPATAGSKNATATLTDDDKAVAGSTQTISLTGTTPPTADLSTNSVDFGNQGVGTASAAKSITVTNNGGTALNFTAAPSLSGANAADFAVASGTTCTNGSNVNPGANCVVNLTFTPAATGARGPATLTLTDNAPNSPQTATLNGAGIDFAIAGPAAPVPVTAGVAVMIPLTLTPGANGFLNPVALDVTGLPPNTTASFDKNNVPIGNSPLNVTLTLATTAHAVLPPQAPLDRRIPRIPQPLVLLAVAAILLALGSRRLPVRTLSTQRLRVTTAPLFVVGTLLLIAYASGCAGEGFPPGQRGTPPGNYTITVKVTSGTLSHQVAVQLNVK